jgi:hypothetical protein
VEIIRRLLGIRPTVVYLPLEGKAPTQRQYLEALQRIASTADGKVLIAEFRYQLMMALGNVCPPDLKTPQERSQWMAAHEAVVSARRDLLLHFEKNVELLRKDTGKPPLPAPSTIER